MGLCTGSAQVLTPTPHGPICDDLPPFIASLIEAIGGTCAGVQNAWNKNPSQIERDA
jgi:hypothetical protein